MRTLWQSVALCLACIQFLGIIAVYLTLHGHSWTHKNSIDILHCNNTIIKSIRLHEADKPLLEAHVRSMLENSLPHLTKAFPNLLNASQESQLAIQEQHLAKEEPCMHFTDETWGVNPTSNIPGVENIHEELHSYIFNMSNHMMSDFHAASQHQQHPTAKDLRLVPHDRMNDLHSISARIAFLNKLSTATSQKERTRVAVATTTSADIYDIRKLLLPWLQYHTELGISKFFILYDGKDDAAVRVMHSIRHIELIHIHRPWATPVESLVFEAYQNIIQSPQEQGNATGLRGNYELMNKQGYGVQESLRRSKAAGFDWLLHLDPDELFYPGGPTASITAELERQPDHVPAVRFMNYEAQPEISDVINRFEQVTLFRVHKHFITPEAMSYRSTFKLGSNAAFLLLYANGKSAVRVSWPGVQHAGPHYFTGRRARRSSRQDGTPDDAWINAVSDSSVVLHYAYSSIDDVAKKAKHSCPVDDASIHSAISRHDVEFVKKMCFVIDFDAEAFMAAAGGQKSIEEFYFTRMVLSEGSIVECIDASRSAVGWCPLTNIPRFIFLMEKLGLMKRILMPQMLLRQHEQRIVEEMRDLVDE